MSHSDTYPSSLGTLKDDEPEQASRDDRSDRKPPNAEVLEQHKDMAQNDPETSQSTAIEQKTASKPSTPSPGSDNNKVHEVSTQPEIKQIVFPCVPCVSWDIACDGVRPKCYECAWRGRRCSFL